MMLVKQLFALQELDLALDRVQGQRDMVEQELTSPTTLEHVKTALEEETQRLKEAEGQHRVQQLETESHRERSTRLDQQLYGGAITNPRELESLERESAHVHELLQQQDAHLLELSLLAEESRKRCDHLEKELADTRAEWQSRQAELNQRLKSLAAEGETVDAQRSKLAAALDVSAVQRYEALRRAKGGLAVAKVVRGLCQACRMSLPTQLQQRVRSGRQTVLCSSCGRMLLLS
jgi:predicted  nucleic acid-binding Zn-ribbon protein